MPSYLGTVRRAQSNFSIDCQKQGRGQMRLIRPHTLLFPIHLPRCNFSDPRALSTYYSIPSQITDFGQHATFFVFLLLGLHLSILAPVGSGVVMPPTVGGVAAMPLSSISTSIHNARAERRLTVATNIAYPSRSVRNISWSGPTIPLLVAQPSSETKVPSINKNESVGKVNGTYGCFRVSFDFATVRWVKDSVFLARVTARSIFNDVKDRFQSSYNLFWTRDMRL